jgi:hypothetical protein
MYRKLFPLLVIGFSGFTALLSDQAIAQTPLTRATIQELRNLVQLMPQKQPKRKARRADAMTPGDGLSTGRSSLADLRFNDGSLARVGEQAIFKFLPTTRNFTLNNGTVLLLIPPGQGRTRIQTPSAAAAIRGSALFVRYDRATDTTVIGALTNSGIEVLEKNASSGRVLKAGQMMVVIKGKLQGLYDFDLRTFYNTSEMVRGLELNRPVSASSTSDPAINSVRAETVEAMSKQSPISGAGTIQNPGFLQLTSTSSDTNASAKVTPPVDSLLDQSSLQSSQRQDQTSSSNPTPVNGDKTPTSDIKNPPSSGDQAGATPNPPKVDPPKVDPPKVDPPKVDPPKVDPPKVDPPKVDPPKVDPPKVDPPKVDPPKVDPPKVDPPKVDPPKVDPPKVDPPKVDPPKVDPPKVDPPKVDPPKVDPRDLPST